MGYRFININWFLNNNWGWACILFVVEAGKFVGEAGKFEEVAGKFEEVAGMLYSWG